MKYDFKTVEAKWQKVWEDEDTFHAEIDHSKPKFYALVEFPYPSAAGRCLIISGKQGGTTDKLLSALAQRIFCARAVFIYKTPRHSTRGECTMKHITLKERWQPVL